MPAEESGTKVSCGRVGFAVMLNEDLVLAVVLHRIKSGVIRSDLVGGQATIFLADTAAAHLRTFVVVHIHADVHVIHGQAGHYLHSPHSPASAATAVAAANH